MPIDRSTFLSATASLGAAAVLPVAAAAQTKPLDLRVAANPNDTFASAFYARDEGIFAQNGLNVDLQTISNGAAIAAAVISDAVDVGIAVPVTLASAYLKGLPVEIVAASSVSSVSVATTRLAVLGSSDIKGPKDLEGKTVAINALNVGLDLSLDVWLAQGGADKTKVKLVELPFSEMGEALERHTVDAAILAEPSYTLSAQQFHIRTLANMNSAIAPVYVTSCWFSTRSYVQSHPEQIRRFVRAIYQAQKWGNTHHDASAAILAKYSKMDLALARTMSRAVYAEALRPADIQIFLDAAAKYGGLPSQVSVTNFIYQP